MAVDKRSQGQMSLFDHTLWRTVVVLEMNHRLVRLCQSIPWDDLMEKAIPILYEENGISPELGRPLDLRAHLGAYILQATYGWTDRWTQEMLNFYIPARIFCGYLESEAGLDRTSIEVIFPQKSGHQNQLASAIFSYSWRCVRLCDAIFWHGYCYLLALR